MPTRRRFTRYLPAPANLAWRVTLLFAVGLFLEGCSTPITPTLSAEQIIKNSVESMQQLAGFQFSIAREGAPAFIDPDRSLAFRRAAGSFESPDAARADVRIIGPGIVVDIVVVAIGERQWESIPLSGEWQEVPEGYGFNPAEMLSPTGGLQQVLANELGDIQFMGMDELEELPGVDLFRLSAELRGPTLQELSFGLISDEQPSIQLWVEPGTFYLHRLQVHERPGAGEQERTWIIDFWDFGHLERIEPPLP